MRQTRAADTADSAELVLSRGREAPPCNYVQPPQKLTVVLEMTLKWNSNEIDTDAAAGAAAASAAAYAAASAAASREATVKQ